MMGRDWTRNAMSPERDPPTRWQVKGGNNRRRTGRETANPSKEDVNIKWSTPLGSLCISEPVVANGLVWIGTNNDWERGSTDGTVLLCLRESNGEELYRYFSPRLPGGNAVDWTTFPLGCSPLIEGNHVWFTNNRCEVICLDISSLLADGKSKPTVAWKVDMREDLGVAPHGSIMFLARSCSVASYQDWIYVVTNNGVDRAHREVIAPRAPSLICFNKTNGDVVWEDNSPFDRILHGQWASPLVIEVEGRPQVIVPQGDGWLRSFDPAGDGEGGSKVLWEFDMNPKSSKWELHGRGDRNNILATPVFYDGRVYIANGQGPDHGEGVGRLCCIDPTKSGDISSELAVDANGQILNLSESLDRREQVLKKDERAIVNPNSGLVWEFGGIDQDGTITGRRGEYIFRRTFANVAVWDGLVIAPDLTGYVHCLDARSGKRYWEYDTLASIWAAPLIVDGKVYIADEDGIVTILRLSRELHKVEAIEMGPSIWVSPIFVNGVLYVTTNRNLFAIESQPPASGDNTNEREEASLLPMKVDRFEQRIAKKGKNRAPDAIFVPTPDDVVEKMLDLAQVTENDVVCDLGSGDGRIVIAAAKKYGCHAIGYEIDRELVAVSRENVQEAGVEELVRIEHEDIFARDYSEVSVVTMFLPSRVMDRLLPRLARLKPGSRIVSHHFSFSDIPPDETLDLDSKEDGSKHKVYLWNVPLNQPVRRRGT
jgi:outer membrane protein assembly factor BamB